MEHSSASKTINNDVGATSDIFELISGWGDCKLESMTLAQLAQLRSRLNSNASLVEKFSLEREQQEATERSQQSHEICEACKLIKDPRQRKVAEIRQIYLQILNNNKPADLLCTPGIFSRLEEMARDGRLDTLVADGGCPCPKRRKVNDTEVMNTSLTAEILDILKQELMASAQPDCYMDRACSKCLNFVMSSLDGNNDEIELPSLAHLPASANIEEIRLKFLVPEFNKLKKQFSKLSAEVVSNQNSTLKELNTKIELLSDQLKSINNLDEIINYGDILGTPIGLSPFSGKEWESPGLFIKRWEEYLKMSQIPKDEWCQLVCEVLHEKAKDWCTEQNASDNTWDQFARMFVEHFNKDVKPILSEYILSFTFNEKIGLSQKKRVIFLYDTDLKRVLLACLRALGDNMKHLTMIFNTFLWQEKELPNTLTFMEVYCKINAFKDKDKDYMYNVGYCFSMMASELQF